MSLEAEIKRGGLDRGRYLYFPVAPGRVEFTIALRRLLLERRPQVVAIELPSFLEETYRKAVARLPEMSVILYTEESKDDDERAIYVPVEPADPFTEALRTADEIGAQVLFLEPDSNERPHLPDNYPDTYAIARIGMDKYVEAYRVWPQPRTEEVTAHASAMAWKLQGADPDARIVAVVSLNLLDPLLDAMEIPQEAPAIKRRNPDVRLLNPHPECLAEITVEYPYLQERYEFFRLDLAEPKQPAQGRLGSPDDHEPSINPQSQAPLCGRDQDEQPAQGRLGSPSDQELPINPPSQAPLCGRDQDEQPAQGRLGSPSDHEPSINPPSQAPLCGRDQDEQPAQGRLGSPDDQELPINPPSQAPLCGRDQDEQPAQGRLGSPSDHEPPINPPSQAPLCGRDQDEQPAQGRLGSPSDQELPINPPSQAPLCGRDQDEQPAQGRLGSPDDQELPINPPSQAPLCGRDQDEQPAQGRLGSPSDQELPINPPSQAPLCGRDQEMDRPRVQLDLLREAEAKYTQSTGDKLAHWQRRMIARYTRNLAHTSGDLTANVYDLTVAARSIVDDNYGWEVWQMANRYLAQHETSNLETVHLSASEIWINTKRLRIRRRLPRPKQRLKPAGLKARKKETQPGEWARQTTGNAICSYPPEDLVIEEYGRFLKKKAKAMLSEERVRVEPFTTSILDGIDLRETIRNWSRRKIYVRQADRLAGEAGAVVVIFDEDREDRYQYLTTWLGEHQNESDMAFYSTFPFDNLVGPGIGRAEYGGILMTLPPRRLFDVWADTDYDFAESKPERLLMAALDYSVERFVVYVAARPPRSIFRSIAAHVGRKILYVPIGALSPAKLKKLRVVHVLDSYERRTEAKDYLW